MTVIVAVIKKRFSCVVPVPLDSLDLTAYRIINSKPLVTLCLFWVIRKVKMRIIHFKMKRI